MLVSRDRSYLPKKTFLRCSSVAFIIILLASVFSSVDPWKSFWSNQERMEGFVTLFEIFVLFITASSVFAREFARDSKNKGLTNSAPSNFGLWNWFLNYSLVISIFMGFYALVNVDPNNPRISGTLGNSSYLGGYAMVHGFIAFYLLIVVIRKILSKAGGAIQDMGVRISLIIFYSFSFIFELHVVYCTGTRGSFMGILLGLFAISLLWVIAERKYIQFRIAGAILILLGLAVVSTFGFAKNTNYVKQHPLLDRFASLVTLDFNKILENQGHARIMLWTMAYQGVKERPVLGWGQDNFGYVFAKYYNPSMYDQEEWFDRTHNVFFDWLIAAGILGLLSYLSLFVAALYILWKRGNDDWSAAERAVITGLLLAYFMHNVFVFDNLVSYVFFFLLLAFINARGQNQLEFNNNPILLGASRITVDILVFALGVYLMWISVFSPIGSSSKIIEAMSGKTQSVKNGLLQEAEISPKDKFELIKNAIDANNLARSESIERLGDISLSVLPQLVKTDPVYAQSVYKYTIDKLEGESKRAAGDPRPYYFYAMFQEKVGNLSGSLDSIRKAEAESPNKQSFMYFEAEVLLEMKKLNDALAVLKKAYELDKNNGDALKYYSQILIEGGNINIVDTLVADKASSTPSFDSTDFWVDAGILQALADAKQFDRLIYVLKKSISKDPSNIGRRISLSAAYLKMGDRQSSVDVLREAQKVSTSSAATLEVYIKQIEAGKDPTNVGK